MEKHWKKPQPEPDRERKCHWEPKWNLRRTGQVLNKHVSQDEPGITRNRGICHSPQACSPLHDLQSLYLKIIIQLQSANNFLWGQGIKSWPLQHIAGFRWRSQGRWSLQELLPYHKKLIRHYSYLWMFSRNRKIEVASKSMKTWYDNVLDFCLQRIFLQMFFRVLMHELCTLDLTFLTYKQKLAFWINIYNASIMHVL